MSTEYDKKSVAEFETKLAEIQLPALFLECPFCKSGSSTNINGQWRECPYARRLGQYGGHYGGKCRSGWIMTPAGESLLEFVVNHASEIVRSV